MDAKAKDHRYDAVRRCLAEAEKAFARAGATDDEHERQRLIDEAEALLVLAERTLARLVDRPTHAEPHRAPREERSFGAGRPAHRTLLWRRTPRA